MRCRASSPNTWTASCSPWLSSSRKIPATSAAQLTCRPLSGSGWRARRPSSSAALSWQTRAGPMPRTEHNVWAPLRRSPVGPPASSRIRRASCSAAPEPSTSATSSSSFSCCGPKNSSRSRGRSVSGRRRNSSLGSWVLAALGVVPRADFLAWLIFHLASADAGEPSDNRRAGSCHRAAVSR